MKIGEEAYVHGYIDEIRNGVIIIRNKGGYFGTEPEEVFPSAQPERKIELHGDESAIEILSELRSWFSCFDEKEGLAYHALSLAIRAIKANSIVQAEQKKGVWKE